MILARILRADNVSNAFVNFEVVGPIVTRAIARQDLRLTTDEALAFQKKVVLMIHQVNYYYHAFVMSRLFKNNEISEIKIWARQVFGAWIASDPRLKIVFDDYVAHGDGFDRGFVSGWLRGIAD